MKNDELVSFVIAAYNVEKYIKECVDSCLNQTYSNIQVCITDDGSKDNTWDILNKYYSKDNRVKLSKFDKNRGKVAAYNNSVEMASGKYIAVLGADDISFKYRIEEQIKYMKQSRSISLVYGDLEVTDEKLNKIKVLCSDFIEDKEERLKKLLNNNIISGGTMLVNSKFKDIIFPVPNKLLFEDWWIAFIANYYGDIVKVNKPLIKYRQHSKNDNGSFNKSIPQVINLMKRDYKRHFNYYEHFKDFINRKVEDDIKRKLYNDIISYNSLKREFILSKNLFERIRIKKKYRYLKINSKNLIYFLFGDNIIKGKLYIKRVLRLS
ncbi:glycosyltransferase [Clostridium sp. A1-XYC3]|uniref:Glycosyltransferase n=1 Tax=Clostridium tanneri TaxID=3037988 RepID=A0ABU4JYF8_9CLOT|nr:glycosyltransferase [Clostridium sp. A1-XYC3]MDW8803192.1 glycosyltransferase [Clostridium sp. A1-XYC3]